MNIGAMRSRITLRQKQTTKDNEGLVTEQWVDQITVWSAYEDVSRWKEFFQAAAVNAENYVKFIIRYRDVTTDMRVMYEGIEYTIVSTSDPNGLHKETHLICKRVTTGG